MQISDADRIRAALHPDALTPEQRVAWLERVVWRAVETHALDCGIDEVEAWAQGWLGGVDRSVEAADAAARAVADAAAWAVADVAAVWAALWAARAVAEAEWAEWAAWALEAAEYAAEAAVERCVAEAARKEERQRQVADLIAVMEETNDQ